MLTIQRASAGSGKTYTLAQKFIFNILFYQDGRGRFKIRNVRQMEDGLTHILAVTFTNKATNEMKQRIIDNLSLLSKAAKGHIETSLAEKIPNLKKFKEATGFSVTQIGSAAADALKVILNNYSQFKISTIDSFFQEILRTFAYEANISDSYQLEIDSSFVADSALDAAINELDTHPQDMGAASFWLKTIMKNEVRKNQNWNPFNKKTSEGSIYSKIRGALFQLEKEDYKNVKEDLDNYYNEKDNILSLPQLYKDLQDKAIQERDTQLKKLKKLAGDIEDYILKNRITDSQLNRYFPNHLKIIKNLNIDQVTTFSYDKMRTQGTVCAKEFKGMYPNLDSLAMEMYDCLDGWNNPSPDSYFKNWNVYGKLLPYLGLIFEVKTFLSEVLKANNLIQISDTGFILKKIIGQDDAPFVYERIGNRIDHYLIDEFQDTSRMQWDVIHPLLKEGLAKDQDSLIIGDPKQSIYRFRNADHRLILEDVPNAFENNFKAAGFSKEENTNWRSNTQIIKFNNYFFKTLSLALDDLSRTKGKGTNFSKLYANVVQKPHNTKGKGYVEVRLLNDPSISLGSASKKGKGKKNNNKDWFENEALSNLNSLISSLTERGYRYKDIVILVNKNEESALIVDSLIRYNDSLTDGNKKINFISEDSLLVASSPAVAIILGVLEKICKPSPFIKYHDSTEGTQKPKYVNWENVKVNYSIYSQQHPEMEPARRIMAFLNENEFNANIGAFLKDLSTPSLSSLVEQTVKSLLDEDMKKSDAIYISAFQDIVSDYAAGHPNDPASFLEWWKKRGKNIAVSSPDSMDAVQIMTIHKSKGLEFKCVIVPFAADSFMPNNLQSEWRWVKPVALANLSLPPYLPVTTSSTLKGSHHEAVYSEYFDEIVTDKLNRYYVAFTRARNELYIFTKDEAGKTPSTVSHFINQILKGRIKPSSVNEEESDFLLELEQIEINEKENRITFGSPFTSYEIEEEYEKERQKKDEIQKTEIKEFNGYYVNSRRPKLRSLATKVAPSGEQQET